MILRSDLCGSRLRRVEGGFQGPQIAVTHDLVEALLGSEESRGHPAQDHVAVLPVSDAAGLDAHTGVRTFDDVGGGQAAAQRRRYIQAVDGEALLNLRRLESGPISHRVVWVDRFCPWRQWNRALQQRIAGSFHPAIESLPHIFQNRLMLPG